MFARWKHARIRAAERALRDGRLDEALERFQASGEKNVSDAQQLRDDLAAALLARARLHARAARYPEARHDIQRLTELGLAEDRDVRELAQRVRAEFGDRAAKEHQAHAARRSAEAKLAAGRLESGRHAIERVEQEDHRRNLQDALDARIARSDELLEQARAALNQNDLTGGINRWKEATERYGQTTNTDALAGVLGERVRKHATEQLNDGRLDDLRALLANAAPLTQVTGVLDSLQRTYRRLEEAAAALAARDLEQLRVALLALQNELPKAKWLRTLEQNTRDVLDKHALLQASPLDVLSASFESRPQIGTPQSPKRGETNRGQPPQPSAERRYLLLLDGTGSALLTTREVVRLGRMGGGAHSDLELPGDLLSHHATIHRDGDDYFLSAVGPAEVNRHPVQRKLLRDGDRIQLGRSVRMVFSQPSERSGSATLKLSSRNRLNDDVSMVVLFKDTCLVGPQRSCHIRTREGRAQLVLFEQGRSLAARRPGGKIAELPENRTVEIDDLSLTLKRLRS